MERLQAAIEKARASRSGQPNYSNPQGAEHTHANWEALTEFKVNGDALERRRVYTGKSNEAAVAFDILRTRTLRMMQKHGWRRLAITSPTPACGKSTISLNLAFSMARQAGNRIVLNEIDMRQPSQRKLLGIQKNKSQAGPDDTLKGFLSGDVEFGDVAVRYGDRLAFATNNSHVPNASDLLLGASVGPALAKVEADYAPDVMIFDMPPMLVNDDTIAFQQHIDCVLIVAAAESSTVAEIEKCERDLAEQTNVLGVVLNKCKLQAADARYGYNTPYGN